MKWLVVFAVCFLGSVQVSYAGSPTYFCPACSHAMHCQRTMPNEATGSHPLERERQSLWLCKTCGARYLLRTPAGRLHKVAKNQHT